MKYLSNWFFYSGSLVPREDWFPYVKVIDLDLIIYEKSAKAETLWLYNNLCPYISLVPVH